MSSADQVGTHELMKSEEFLDRMVCDEKLASGQIEQLVPQRVRRATVTTADP